MIFTRVRDQIALMVLFAAGQAAALWFKRTEWLGSGVMTGQSYVNSTMWPAVLLAAIGAVVGWLPTHRSLQPYFATAVLSERSWAIAVWRRMASAWALSQVVALVGVVVVNLAVDGFAQPQLPLLILGVIWPLVWLTIGMLGFLVAVQWRLLFVVIAPLLCFYSIAGAAQLKPGPIASLSPVNIIAGPTASDSLMTSLLRLAVWVLLAGLVGALLWKRRLGWLIAVACSLSLTASMILLPGVAADDAKASRVICSGVDGVEVCHAAWQQASAPRLEQTASELIAATPERLRFDRVWLVFPVTPDPRRDLLVGAPGGNANESPWPDEGLVRTSYVSALVSQRCNSATSHIFIVRGYRAFGLTNLRLGPGQLTSDQLRGVLDSDGVALLAALDALPDSTYFAWLIKLSLDPQWCNAPPGEWLTK